LIGASMDPRLVQLMNKVRELLAKYCPCCPISPKQDVKYGKVPTTEGDRGLVDYEQDDEWPARDDEFDIPSSQDLIPNSDAALELTHYKPKLAVPLPLQPPVADVASLSTPAHAQTPSSSLSSASSSSTSLNSASSSSNPISNPINNDMLSDFVPTSQADLLDFYSGDNDNEPAEDHEVEFASDEYDSLARMGLGQDHIDEEGSTLSNTAHPHSDSQSSSQSPSHQQHSHLSHKDEMPVVIDDDFDSMPFI